MANRAAEYNGNGTYGRVLRLCQLLVPFVLAFVGWVALQQKDHTAALAAVVDDVTELREFRGASESSDRATADQLRQVAAVVDGIRRDVSTLARDVAHIRGSLDKRAGGGG